MSQGVPSISISDLSKYYQFNCEKLVQKIVSKKPKSTNENENKKNKTDNLIEASKKRGNEFELEIKNKLNNVVDCQYKSYKDLLRNVHVGQTFYQMKFDVPENVYNANIKDIIKLKSFIPDFIEVIREDGETKLMVWDVKSSKSTRISHQFQAASYVYLLKYIIQDFPALSISHTIGIRLPHLPLQTFNIDLLLQRIDKFFRKDLPKIIRTKEPFWYYNTRCRTCDFVHTCREDAKGSISMIPHLSPENAESLRTFVSSRNDVVDIEDLTKIVVNEDNDVKKSDKLMIKQIIKYDKKSKRSPYLRAKKTKRAQFVGLPVANFPQKTDHNLLITMSLDPFLSHPFGWGICLFTGDGEILQKYRRAESFSKESQKKFVPLMDEFVTMLTKCFEYLSQVKSRACIFVYSEREKTTIQDALLEIITTDDNTVSCTLQHAATRCLFNLFEDSSLITASGSKDDNIMEIPDSRNEWREFPRLIILEHAIKENIAIYVPGFYRFIDIWQQLVKPTLSNDQELLNSLEQHITKIDLENIYTSWVSEQSSAQQKIQEAHLLRIKFVNAVMKAYYKLLKESTDNDIASILIFTPPIFTFTEIKSFNNHYLGKLYFFKQYEAITECMRIRSKRIKDFTQDESIRGVQLRYERFINKVNNEWIVKFTIINNEKDASLLEPSSFKTFILVEDSPKGLREAIKFSDMEYRNKNPSVLSLAIVCLEKVENRTIYLKGTFKMDLTKITNCRLYKRYFDFNLNKVLTTFAEIDERNDDNKSVSMDLLKDPNAWGSGSSIEERQYKKIKSTTSTSSLETFCMSPSQKEISEDLLKKRLQIVWGPPGSGKTQFLALFITWYLSMLPKLTDTNRKYVIGVTAFTKEAIANLLERISCTRKYYNRFTIFSMIENMKGDDIKVCKGEDLSKKIARYKGPVVIGGTVWDWYKLRKTVKCDIMMIDEGSQLLVSDAILAIECLNPRTGKLIVAGDHMQLGPIIKNSYPKFPYDHPLIFGSIQQCLMRRKDGSIMHEEDLKEQKYDFGHLTTQLKENWRMNEELNKFFQKIYGKNYISKNPNLKLALNDNKLSQVNPLIRKILSPDSAITLVIIKNSELVNSDTILSDQTKTEAEVVKQITSSYFKLTKVKEKQKLLIVTPFRRQRLEIKSRLEHYIKNENLQINTVDKIQGQEADIVIACFGFFNINKTSKESKFLFEMNRWNVALSIAKSKLIVITTDEMLDPDDIEIFANKKISEGLEFLHMVKKHVQDVHDLQEKDPVVDNSKRKRRRVDDNGVIEWIVNGREKRQKEMNQK
ncbi:P-loop containing nucleoside triphosphate hydrolase protein [Rhizophagus irregularis]|uniref:P-loop containing nucleoside triphosphate hydrolase protein n=1 Tax=Rhizophagus irregularis TaxID=588596 RepID=A0A2N0RTN9_9GLOM|nr:P-loop containing nucleoside triphosphate hydrolase protein [Rhizophagus irregularis]